MKGQTPAVDAKLEIIKVETSEEELPKIYYKSELTKEEFDNILNKGDRKIYTFEEKANPSPTAFKRGHLRAFDQNSAG